MGDGYIYDDLQSELETWKKNYIDAAMADDQLRAMESRTMMLRNEVDRLQNSIKVTNHAAQDSWLFRVSRRKNRSHCDHNDVQFFLGVNEVNSGVGRNRTTAVQTCVPMKGPH